MTLAIENSFRPTILDLEFLGFRLSSPMEPPSDDRLADQPRDIEKLLFKICLYLEFDDFDGRLASVLVTWIKVHGEKVFVDKLRIMREKYAAEFGRDVHWLRYLAYFSLSLKRHNWQPLASAIVPPGSDILFYLGNNNILSKAMLRRWGLESFLPHNSPLKIHRGAIRVRENDVLDPAALMVRNPQYANRYRYGANLRADVVSAIDAGEFASPRELSEFLGLSREAVRKNWGDYKAFLGAQVSIDTVRRNLINNDRQ